MLWEKIRRTCRLDGKRFKRCILVFMLLICKSLCWKSLCLLLTATRNAIFPSLPEDAYSMTSGLQYQRRMRDLDCPVLLEMGHLLTGGVGESSWTLVCCLQGCLAGRESTVCIKIPRNFKLS